MVRLLLALLVAAALSAPAARAQGYLIQLGDRLDISVLEDPALNRTVLVRPDGRISLPLAGTIQAAGTTPEAVEAAIRRSLSRQFVQPPTVTVAVVGLGRQPEEAAGAGAASIYVLGQVGRPGVYQVTLPIDALRVLALAGGPGVFAARDRVQIRRRLASGGETMFLFDYDSIERGALPTADVQLADGDVIVVPERRLFD
jgi:polysaccharide export outer membrane protein